MKTFNLTTEIRGALRLIFRKSPHRKAALNKVRVEFARVNKDGSRSKVPGVWYTCAECDRHIKEKEAEIDHIIPIGPAPGTRDAPPSLTWNQFIEKMFCGTENLQVICKGCHKIKTKKDRNARLSKTVRR